MQEVLLLFFSETGNALHVSDVIMDCRRGANSMGKRKSAMLVFRILEILRNHATRSKPMKLMRILERLDADYTESVDRGTLKDYISEISGEEGDDTPVICEGHGRKGYYARQYFTDMELRILINDVLAARQIEENIAKGLIKKAHSPFSCHP